MSDTIADVRLILQQFQDGYIARDTANLDQFMKLFVPSDDAELIGIGASAPNQHEWFQGTERIREIIESDWQFWGDVKLEVENAKITIKDDVAWLSTVGAILQTEDIFTDEVTDFTLKQMKEMLDNESVSPQSRLVEVAHFGVRRWREREKPVGYDWPFVFTAVLVRHEGQWCFHTIHWSMPVD